MFFRWLLILALIYPLSMIANAMDDSPNKRPLPGYPGYNDIATISPSTPAQIANTENKISSLLSKTGIDSYYQYFKGGQLRKIVKSTSIIGIILILLTFLFFGYKKKYVTHKYGIQDLKKMSYKSCIRISIILLFLTYLILYSTFNFIKPIYLQNDIGTLSWYKSAERYSVSYDDIDNLIEIANKSSPENERTEELLLHVAIAYLKIGNDAYGYWIESAAKYMSIEKRNFLERQCNKGRSSTLSKCGDDLIKYLNEYEDDYNFRYINRIVFILAIVLATINIIYYRNYILNTKKTVKAEYGIPYCNLEITENGYGFKVTFKKLSIRRIIVFMYLSPIFIILLYSTGGFSFNLSAAIILCPMLIYIIYRYNKPYLIEVNKNSIIIDNKHLNRQDFNGFNVGTTYHHNKFGTFSTLAYRYGMHSFNFGGDWDENQATEFCSALNHRLRAMPSTEDEFQQSPKELREAARPTDF